jgi:hypothetical protein
MKPGYNTGVVPSIEDCFASAFLWQRKNRLFREFGQQRRCAAAAALSGIFDNDH